MATFSILVFVTTASSLYYTLGIFEVLGSVIHKSKDGAAGVSSYAGGSSSSMVPFLAV